MLNVYFDNLNARFNQLAKIHRSRVTAAWLEPEPQSPFFLIFAACLVAIAISANVYVRHNQLQIWQSTESSIMTSGAPTFSTADAPFFLGHAATYKQQKSAASFDSQRSYPNKLEENSNVTANSSMRNRLLLPILIASFAEGSKPADLLKTGNYLILATVAITSLAICICFGAVGYWSQGAIASLGGGLSTAYLVRSSIGRIDTDQLNLGFMYLIFGLVVFAGRSASPLRCLMWCVAAGAAANLFMWWYGKPELILMAAIALSWLISCLHRNVLTIVAGTAIFLALSGFVSFDPFSSPYLREVFVEEGFIFTNTYETITEIQIVSLAQILVNATGSVEMGLFCLAGLALFLVRHPVIAIAYGPLVAFGLLNFVIGNRAIFYSAPIMWFGAAFLITTTSRYIASNLSENSYGLRRDQSATVLAACLAMIIAWVNSPTDYVPRPSFPKPVLEGFASLKASADPTNSVVATWWDYGYASMLFNELPTFHDGGSQTTPSTHFVARAFLNPDQTSTIGNLKFLSTKGHEGIAAESSLAGLQEKFGEAVSAPSPDLYLVVTSQMAGWMGSISQIGNWDIEKGEPIALRGNPNGPMVNYEPLNCRLGGYPQTLSCAGTAFDLERGLINGTPLLAGWAHSQDGTTIRGKSFDHNGDFGVQIIQTGNRINVFLMHQQLFESSFNELFYLGQIDHPSISLHYDNYPHIRIYKIDGEPAG